MPQQAIEVAMIFGPASPQGGRQENPGTGGHASSRHYTGTSAPSARLLPSASGPDAVSPNSLAQDPGLPSFLPATTGSTGRDPAAQFALPAPPAPPAPAPPVTAQVALAALSAPGTTVELLLAPEELGHVFMRLSLDDGQYVLTISTERPETLDLMRRNADQLAREFAGAGYAGVALAFEGGGTRADGGEMYQGSGQPGDHGQGRDTARPLDDAAHILSPRPTGPAEGRVDLRL
jgi:flagellar hook-length control protein FliK